MKFTIYNLQYEHKRSSWREVSSVRGQSLFEVVVALFVVTLIMITLVALAVTSVRNSDFSKNKALATRHAQEASEWLRGERDEDWDVFSTRAAGAPGQRWCLNSLSWPATPGGCGSSFIQDGIFQREVTLLTLDPVTIETQVIVYWNDSLGRHEVNATTNLTNWRAE